MQDLTQLTDIELQAYYKKIRFDVTKFHNLQLAKKIQLNSAYGALGNQYFRFFDVRQAEAVTLSGQYVIHKIHNDLNKYFNKLFKTKDEDFIIALDTDSVYIKLDKIVDSAFENKERTTEKCVAFIEKYCQNYLQKEINNCYSDIAEYTNAFQQKMRMKLESIASKGIWTAKKRYILNVLYNEGVLFNKPEIKITGLQAIQTSVPKFCRTKIKAAIDVIINSSEREVQNYIVAIRKEFKTKSPEDIAIPKTCNNLLKYAGANNTFKSKTPIQVRGSLIYNRMLRDQKLDKKYPMIHEGEKIKYLHLKEPNPAMSYVISIPDKLPKEFDLESHIDYDVQFDKTFKEPLRTILEAIGWSIEKRNDLTDFLVDE